jgi:hypothetical protein
MAVVRRGDVFVFEAGRPAAEEPQRSADGDDVVGLRAGDPALPGRAEERDDVEVARRIEIERQRRAARGELPLAGVTVVRDRGVPAAELAETQRQHEIKNANRRMS